MVKLMNRLFVIIFSLHNDSLKCKVFYTSLTDHRLSRDSKDSTGIVNFFTPRKIFSIPPELQV